MSVQIPETPTPSTEDTATADMRQALLEAGKEEFANFGYDGARLERIAAKAGFFVTWKTPDVAQGF